MEGTYIGLCMAISVLVIVQSLRVYLYPERIVAGSRELDLGNGSNDHDDLSFTAGASVFH